MYNFIFASFDFGNDCERPLWWNAPIFEDKVTEGTVYQAIHFSDSLRAVKMLKHDFNRKQ